MAQTYIAIEQAGIDDGFYRSTIVATPESGSVLIVLYSDDLEHTQQNIKNASGEIVKDIFSFPGGRRFHFTYPSGNEYAMWSE